MDSVYGEGNFCVEFREVNAASTYGAEYRRVGNRTKRELRLFTGRLKETS